jgi:hypothetical protein
MVMSDVAVIGIELAARAVTIAWRRQRAKFQNPNTKVQNPLNCIFTI